MMTDYLSEWGSIRSARGWTVLAASLVCISVGGAKATPTAQRLIAYGYQGNGTELICDTLAKPPDDGVGTVWLIALKGRHVVAWTEASGATRVLLRTPAGRIVAVGREGEGPGEFRSVANLTWLGDTLWVSDPSAARLQGFNADGKYIRGIPLPRAGLFVPRGNGVYISSVATGTLSSLHHSILRTRIPFNRFDTLLSLTSAPDKDPMYPLAFRSRSFARGSANGGYWCVVGQQEVGDFTLKCVKAGGEVALSMSLRFGRIPLSDETWQNEVALLAKSSRSTTTDIVNRFHRPKSLPPLYGLLVGDRGEVWILRTPSDGPSSTWERIQSNGKMLPAVVLPARLTPRVLEGDASLVGSMADENGFQAVVRCTVHVGK